MVLLLLAHGGQRDIQSCSAAAAVRSPCRFARCCLKLSDRRYFQHAHFIPLVGVGKRGEYELVHGDLLRQHLFGTTLRFSGPVPADSRQ